MQHLKITLVFLFCFCLSINSQTNSALPQAKIDYKNKEYSKALPIFEQEYNAKPTDPSLNLWYGVCLFETNTNLKKAEECLLIAASKRLPESYLYLGDIYAKEYRVSESEEYYDLYAKARPKEKETTLKDRYQYIEKLQKLISRTEDIQIIDSLIVDKSAFLSAYKLSPDTGTLTEFNSFFNQSGSVESVVYTNGKGSKIYFGQPIEQKYVLSSMDKLANGFGNEKTLSDDNFGLSGNTNYPFVLSDGVTLYFSGIDKNGVGGYDIYLTRYNLNNDSYLTPVLLNMPFNSTANDYLMVIDETKGIGWFATDRYQPEGKVCVYTFIPNEETILIETDDDKQKENRARIRSIKDTWKPEKDYSKLITEARREIQKKVERKHDFTFVIDDTNTYHNLNDFKSSSAKSLFNEMVSKKKEIYNLEKELEQKRLDYSKASSDIKQTLSSQILQLENKLPRLYKEVTALEVITRNEEIEAIK